MKKSQTIFIAVLIFVVLSVAFGISLYFMMQQNKSYADLYNEELIRIIYNDESIGEFTLPQLIELSAPKTFNAAYKPSYATTTIYRDYEGIELRLLFEALNISLEGKTEVSFTGSDGYKSVYSALDILKEDNVFVAFKYDGKKFEKGLNQNIYPEEEGGAFVVIRAFDQFSQNRVKTLVEIEL